MNRRNLFDMSSVHTPHPPNNSNASLPRPPSASRNRQMQQSTAGQPAIDAPSLPSLAYDPSASKPSVVSSKYQVNGLHSARVKRPEPGTSQSSPTSESPSPVSARSHPNFGGARGRQSSLKELVDRFNQTPDDVPPVPRKSSKSTPRASRASSIKPISPSQATSPSQGSVKTSFEDVIPSSQRLFQDGGQALTNGSTRRMSSTSQQSPRDTRMRRTSSNNDDRRTEPDSAASRLQRRPLFGEILATSHNRNDAGFGITTSYRRRGSEGSMHSPHPTFPPEPGRSAPWRSSLTENRESSPTSEEILTDDSSSPSRLHHRTKSDVEGAQTLSSQVYHPGAPGSSRKPDTSIPQDHGGEPTSHLSGNARSPRRKPISQSSVHLSGPPSHGRRDSQSRIPLSSRRLSATSDSATSPPSTRANSSIGGYPTALPSPNNPYQSSAHPTPHHRQVHPPDQRGIPPRLPISPSLNAYIQAPLPKQSPPLRSSRPRQHVSNATTAASRARDVRSKDDERPRRPLDIGGLDFAARRQKIQQAFTKSMSERDYHREQRKQQRDVAKEEAKGPVNQEAENPASASQHLLSVDTGQLGKHSTLDLSQEDSPTLGNMTFHQGRGDATDPADAEPSSAVTAETSDSVDTFFDDEPQDDSDGPGDEDADALAPAEDFREASPSSRQSTSRQDDRESIRIMLGETPVLRQGPLQSSGLRHQLDPDPSDPSRNDPAHLSVSTVASEQNVPAWSPNTAASSRTARTTMDSDAYSTINRVLDHYHDPNVVSPEMMDDIQQQIYTKSPELARQGGWDPKKVTQLYLQELARNRYCRNGSIMADGLRRTALRQPDEQSSRSGSMSQPRDSTDEKILSPEKPGHSRSVSLEVVEAEVKPQRASMNHPDDWNMSPSIADWIAPQAEDSPSDEKAPTSIKGPRAMDREPQELDDEEPSRSRRMAQTSRPQLPTIEGTGGSLDLAISVTSPQDDDSPVIGHPPLPSHRPPPPPADQAHYVDGASPADYSVSPNTPSSYSDRASSDPFTPRAPTGRIPPMTDYGNERPPSHEVLPGMPQQPSIASEQSSEQSGLETPQSSTDQKLSTSPEEQKRLTQRYHAIKEFVDTEHSFGQDMIVVDDIYKGTAAMIVSPEDSKILFGNSDQIVAFSATFLDALKKAVRSRYVLPNSKRWRSNRQSDNTSPSDNTDDQGSVEVDELNDYEKDQKIVIGEAFRQHIADMERIYGDYVKNVSAANEKLQALQKDKNVVVWLSECRTFADDLTTAWDLDSLLVKPVQRILKYHLMLTQLLQHTPADHPDHGDLTWASNEMKEVGDRLNELKRRQEVINAVRGNRKRKESDVRTGLAKAFGRRTEKVKQEVVPVKVEEDKEYIKLQEKYGDHYFQLQVVMRDVTMYTTEVDAFVNNFNNLCVHIEDFVCVEQSSYPELESKWRKFRMLSRDMLSTALPDHVESVRKHVIEPMTTLLDLCRGPQKFIHKRGKRFADYARFKAIKARGDKPDKKTTEQSEQYQVLNDTLKKEIPKLFALTGTLVEACLNNLVQIQQQWNVIWRKKLSQAIEGSDIPTKIADIITAFSGDFAFHEAQALTLGICNGSLRADAPNLVGMLSPSTTLRGSEDQSSMKRSSASDSQKRRTMSLNSDASPVLPHPDLGTRAGGGLFGETAAPPPPPPLVMPPYQPANYEAARNSNRARASSSVSNNSSQHPDHIPGAYHRSWSSSVNAPSSTPPTGKRPSTTAARSTGPSMSRPSVEIPYAGRQSEEYTASRNRSNSDARPPQQQTSPTGRYPNFFSSAMPMSDTPTQISPPPNILQPQPPPQPTPSTNLFPQPTSLTSPPANTSSSSTTSGREVPSQPSTPRVIFLAASVYEFNIDRARREAGFPYLTYVAGEIFDVLGEKGELWLARNQDDRTRLVGWIWNKHFVKLAS